ncbi:MAG: bifunctional helix-turn-helix transcriptional regulator/GNAT family N-acetyltransferase [Pseudorhodoplanes sp.]|nr:bifunctional helix-turn-helix transcriptional regulator/GNAT family N-acetyltransferase [Pseudorhodoplanes sp.]
MAGAVAKQDVDAVRRFNRFYTRQIGLLQDRLFDSPFSLTQARVLFEISQRGACTASDIAQELSLDHGYLSRTLRRFADDGLISRTTDKADARQSLLTLTAKGRRAFARLDARSHEEIEAMLRPVPAARRRRAIAAMDDIGAILGGKPAPAPAWRLRTHRPGDMGFVVERHGTLYPAEYGWDSRIEALTAEIVAAFLKNFDPVRERCWIAECDGETVGSVFLVRETDEVARLRLLIVDPKARGLGIGRRLVEECIAFARAAGYRKITLWTHAVLVAARAIYAQAGFRLVEEWTHDEFGKSEASETWEFSL